MSWIYEFTRLKTNMAMENQHFLKRRCIFKWLLFHCHVSLWESNLSQRYHSFCIFKKAFSGHLQECVAHLVQSWMSILIVRFQNTMLDILIAYEHRTRPKALKLSFCQICLRIAKIINYTTRVLRINAEIHTKFGWFFWLILWRSFMYTHIWCEFLWVLLVSPDWFTLLRSDFDGVNVENADFTDVPLPCFATLCCEQNWGAGLGNSM